MRYRWLLALLFLLSLSGCAFSDFMFAILGDHYSGGGVTDLDRARDYNERQERLEAAYAAERQKSD